MSSAWRNFPVEFVKSISSKFLLRRMFSFVKMLFRRPFRWTFVSTSRSTVKKNFLRACSVKKSQIEVAAEPDYTFYRSRI